jgi:hypothetical protein
LLAASQHFDWLPEAPGVVELCATAEPLASASNATPDSTVMVFFIGCSFLLIGDFTDEK